MKDFIKYLNPQPMIILEMLILLAGVINIEKECRSPNTRLFYFQSIGLKIVLFQSFREI